MCKAIIDMHGDATGLVVRSIGDARFSCSQAASRALDGKTFRPVDATQHAVIARHGG